MPPSPILEAAAAIREALRCTGELDCPCELCRREYQAAYDKVPEVLKRAVQRELFERSK